MAPKKNQKMSLNEFLGDSTLGSWADEMEALPTAPAPKTDDRAGDRGYARRGDDFLSTRPDRGPALPRVEVPLPTQPPFTAFVGNLAFDLTEKQLGDFFGTTDEIKSSKIIRDRDDKPKGFGYVEFTTVDGLKEALNKNGVTFSNRTIRVNVAEPPKERPGGGAFDDDKFSGNWRRDGPLPDLPGREGGRDGSRRKFDGIGSSEAGRESASENNTDWRSNRPTRFAAEPEVPPNKRRGSGFSTPTPEGEVSPADTEEKWVIGGKFKPQENDSRPGSRFGSMRGKSEMGPPSALPDDGDWRRPRPARTNTSPGSSVPPTPQMGRRKLELLPRSTSASSQATPLSSPKSAGFTASKSSPFGAAKPVDVSVREAQVMEKIEKEKEEIKEKVTQHSMSRQSSRQARPRPGPTDSARSPTTSSSGDVTSPTTTTATATPPAPVSTSSNVRPTFSFANAAAGKKETAPDASKEKPSVENVTEKQEEASV